MSPVKIEPWMHEYQIFLALDYSQVEIRMLAEAAQDKLLLQQFASGADIHCIVGETLTGIPAATIKDDKETRKFIKNFHFGMVYGLDGEGLYYYCKAKGVKTTAKKCIKFREIYFAKYTGVGRFIVATQKFARENNYVVSLFGFQRKLGPNWEEERTTDPENQAVNSPIQGAAHNLLLVGMGLIARYPKKYNLLQNVLAEIHDALLFKMSIAELPEAWRQAKQLMEKDIPAEVLRLYKRKISVPLLADAKAGFRYGTLVDYGTKDYPSLDIHLFLSRWKAYNHKVEGELNEKYNEAA